MADRMSRTGVGCKCLGAWLLITAALLVYAETAASNASPAFAMPLLLLAAGVIFYYYGCFSCARARLSERDAR